MDNEEEREGFKKLNELTVGEEAIVVYQDIRDKLTLLFLPP